MIIKDWPLRTLIPTSVSLDLHWPTRSAGEALGGDEQIGSALSARWQMSMSFGLSDEARGRAYRGVKAGIKGRYVAVRIPICDPFRVHYGDALWPTTPVPTPLEDDVFFDDGTGFAVPQIVTTMAADADLRDETITLEVDSINDALGFGHFLSVLDESLPIYAQDWLHVVTGVGDRTGDNRTFTIAPPLRADIASGSEVQIGRPRSLFRLRDDLSGSAEMQLLRFGTPSMDFVEVMRRDSTT